MNAEQVVEKILSEANAEAEKIVAEASEKASAEDVRLQDELALFQKETDRLAQAAADDRKLQMMATARMDIQKQMLMTKAGLLDDVFAQAKEQINNLPDHDYQQLIISLMEKLTSVNQTTKGAARI